MIKKIKAFFKHLDFKGTSIDVKINKLVEQNKKILEKLEELEWAHIFHDSIRGNKNSEQVRIHPGRWAANYSFLYILVRVLNDVRPSKILEFGLGESSKLISTYAEENKDLKKYDIIEHDNYWVSSFKSRFRMTEKARLEIFQLATKKINSCDVLVYDKLYHKKYVEYDLYIVDGPFGSDKYSRIEIYEIFKLKKKEDDFIIIFDDYNRDGEKQTIELLMEYFRNNKIDFYCARFNGVKSQLVITSSRYKGVLSI
jgi:hypothetical protein